MRDSECTDCGGTGLTYQTERLCSCQTLLQRLRQYEGQSFETTACYNGIRDEAAATIERLTKERDEWEAGYDRVDKTASSLGMKLQVAKARADSLAAELAKVRGSLDETPITGLYVPEGAAPTVSGEPVAWRVKITDNGRTMYTYTEQLPFEPWTDSGVKVRAEPEPLFTHPAPTRDDVLEGLTKPIIGIEYRTAQEVFDIMADRIARSLKGGKS